MMSPLCLACVPAVAVMAVPLRVRAACGTEGGRRLAQASLIRLDVDEQATMREAHSRLCAAARDRRFWARAGGRAGGLAPLVQQRRDHPARRNRAGRDQRQADTFTSIDDPGVIYMPECTVHDQDRIVNPLETARGGLPAAQDEITTFILSPCKANAVPEARDRRSDCSGCRGTPNCSEALRSGTSSRRWCSK